MKKNDKLRKTTTKRINIIKKLENTIAQKYQNKILLVQKNVNYYMGVLFDNDFKGIFDNDFVAEFQSSIKDNIDNCFELVKDLDDNINDSYTYDISPVEHLDNELNYFKDFYNSSKKYLKGEKESYIAWKTQYNKKEK